MKQGHHDNRQWICDLLNFPVKYQASFQIIFVLIANFVDGKISERCSILQRVQQEDAEDLSAIEMEMNKANSFGA